MFDRETLRKLLPRLHSSLHGNSRRGRSGFAPDLTNIQSPEETRKELLKIHYLAKIGGEKQHLLERAKRQGTKCINKNNRKSGDCSDFVYSTHSKYLPFIWQHTHIYSDQLIEIDISFCLCGVHIQN